MDRGPISTDRRFTVFPWRASGKRERRKGSWWSAVGPARRNSPKKRTSTSSGEDTTTRTLAKVLLLGLSAGHLLAEDES